jgi:hypothetical protein
LPFSEISPAESFLSEKGVSGGSPTAKAVEAARLWSAQPTRYAQQCQNVLERKGKVDISSKVCYYGYSNEQK